MYKFDPNYKPTGTKVKVKEIFNKQNSLNKDGNVFDIKGMTIQKGGIPVTFEFGHQIIGLAFPKIKQEPFKKKDDNNRFYLEANIAFDTKVIKQEILDSLLKNNNIGASIGYSIEGVELEDQKVIRVKDIRAFSIIPNVTGFTESTYKDKGQK